MKILLKINHTHFLVSVLISLGCLAFAGCELYKRNSKKSLKFSKDFKITHILTAKD